MWARIWGMGVVGGVGSRGPKPVWAWAVVRRRARVRRVRVRWAGAVARGAMPTLAAKCAAKMGHPDSWVGSA